MISLTNLGTIQSNYTTEQIQISDSVDSSKKMIFDLSNIPSGTYSAKMPLTNEEPGTGSMIYVGGSYIIPTGSVPIGTLVKVEPPIVDTIVGQLGTMFDNTISIPGELNYISPLNRILLVSFDLKLRTTNPTDNDFVKAVLYVNGLPFNNGLVQSTAYISNTVQTDNSIPVAGGPLTAGDIISVYVANMTSTNDIELQTLSIMCGGFSFTTV